MRRLRARGLRAVVAGLAVMWVAGACGDGEGGSAGQGAPSQSVTATADASPTPTPSPSPTVEPADGMELSLDLVTVRAPKGYKPSPALFESAERRAESADGIIAIAMIEIPNRDFEGLTYQQRAKIHRETTPDAKILPPRTVQGEEALHSLRRTEYDVEEGFSVILDGHIVAVTFIHDRDVPDKQRREVVESVLASLTWG